MHYYFADDTDLLYVSKYLANIKLVTNSILKRFLDWLKANTLSLKESKINLISFHHLQLN